ncbi:HEAT repeat domain-containing protein [Aestuariirhabdus sp. LZHN29]|uniref:HEAT repeat domain-containing protein n=1 Tax=Aestuariirhabdus sp. LZHN29 TaxID=3417462 RepID=UPI003CE7D4C5
MTSRAEVVDRLIELLHQGDEVDRCHAAQALGVLADYRARSALYDHLQDEDLDVCVDAAQALGEMGGEDAVQGLVDALAYHDAGDVKLAAVRALSECGGAVALDALRPLVLQRPADMDTGESEGWDDWWDLQLEAVKAVGRHGHAAAITDIMALLDDEEGQDIEIEALKALAQSGAAGVEALAGRLESGTMRTQRRIAGALGHSTHPQALTLLIELTSSSSGEVREAAARALSGRRDGVQAPHLAALLTDPVAAVQVAALEGLRSIDSGALDEAACIELLRSEASTVRQIAMRLLALRVQQASTVVVEEWSELIIASARSTEHEEAAVACQLLGILGTEAGVEVLIEVAGESERLPLVRCQALHALGTLGRCDSSVIEVVVASTADMDGAVRHSAMRTLYRLNSAAGVEALDSTPLQQIHEMLATEEQYVQAAEVDPATDREPSAVEVAPAVDENEAAAVSRAPESASPDLIVTVTVEDEAGAASPESSLQAILEGLSTQYPDTRDESDFVTPVSSTLDAITRTNAEAMVSGKRELSEDSGHILEMVDALPEELAEFGDVVHHNARTGERMLGKKRNRREFTHEARRVLAAQVLAEAEDELSMQKLLACLMDDNPDLRKQATESLGEMASAHPQLDGLSNCLGPLVTQLHGGTEEIRLACARTLGALGHKSAIKPLFAALEDEDTLVRIQAIRSLVEIEQGSGKALTAKDHVSLDEMTPTRIVKAIRGCHDDESIGVRTAVIDALGSLGYADVSLIVAMGLEEGGALSKPAAEALSKMDIEASTALLVQALDNPDSMIRRLAVQMLTRLHGQQVG